MTISRKIGPYILSGTNVILRRSDATPTFVMLVDCSPEYYAQVRAMMGPDVLIEMRWTERDDYQPLDDPERRADEWWARRRRAIEAIPAGDYVVFAGYNEIGTDMAAEFARFEVRRLQHLHNAGRHAAVGSWGVGHPDLPEWIHYWQVRQAMRRGDVWDVHEYASDYADIDNRWHVGRFTIPAVAANLGDWPIVVSEYGYDIVEGKGWPGWQLQPGANNETALAMLRKGGAFYDTQIRVLGVAAYQIGSIDPKFKPFNMYGVWPSVVSEYAAGGAVTPPIQPPVTTPPPSIRLSPPIAERDIVRNPDGSLRITQRFNPPQHYGIDYSCVVGKPIRAAIDGTAHCETQTVNGVMTGFGRYVRLEDGKGTYVYTAHLSTFAIYDRTKVHAGDIIGYSGNTGNSTGPHLHFEVRRGSRLQASAIDPEPLIVWPEAEAPQPPPQPTEPFLPTNDPIMLARKTPKERYEGIRYWIEEAERQDEDHMPEYARAIRLSLIEQMYTWEREWERET